ncbi:tRNA preQ1(34) S-adenosylmethionine ribosyltransferase-isomerase QueA [Peptococcus simiae]|uniref:tRNA preQ1(34) S-adenosylmethionine ribosyltransferase-isomerase QueA n=1 Tax=Peptococcus simiae TaxID=1643805 RepID=UPI00398058DB
MLKTSDFDYDLPEELIAQHPLDQRSASRLMVLDKDTGKVTHHHFYDILDELSAGDVLVLNTTKVIPARLIGQKVGGTAAVEVLLLKRSTARPDCWECLVRPGKRLKPGARISFGDGRLEAEIVGMTDAGRLVVFHYEGIFEEVLAELGTMPLPPYIHEKLEEPNRYQTVYARQSGSAAAPTAGLHMTGDLLAAIKAKGVDICEVLLHVGLGTFQPVKEEDAMAHQMHSEFYEVTDEAADQLNRAKSEGRRIICLGTTSVRTVESAVEAGKVKAGQGWTNIFIYPGYTFQVTDALITNFHLPKSTLLMLVSALAGRETILKAYEEAVAERYRFFSFGDAMFIR